jgi:serine/threonine-protein kinase
MSLRFFATALAAVLFVELAIPGSARADGGGADVKAVETLTNKAYEQASAGKYADAIASYIKAYEISKAGAILFNIAAICDHRLHERTLAMEYYRRYLQATDANPEYAKKATERLSALKAEAAAEEKERGALPSTLAPPPPAPAPPSTSPAPDSSVHPDSGGGSGLRTVGLVVGGIGLAGVGTGLVLGALAKSKNDQANGYCSATACSSDQGVTLEHQAGDLATASTVTFISGAALLATGVIIFLVAPRGTSASTGSLTISPRVSTSSGGFSLQGTF